MFYSIFSRHKINYALQERHTGSHRQEPPNLMSLLEGGIGTGSHCMH